MFMLLAIQDWCLGGTVWRLERIGHDEGILLAQDLLGDVQLGNISAMY